MVKRRTEISANGHKCDRRYKPSDERFGGEGKISSFSEAPPFPKKMKRSSDKSEASPKASECEIERYNRAKANYPEHHMTKLPTISTLLSDKSRHFHPTRIRADKSEHVRFTDDSREDKFRGMIFIDGEGIPRIPAPSERFLQMNSSFAHGDYPKSREALPSYEGKDLLGMLNFASEIADRYLSNSDMNKSVWNRSCERSPSREVQGPSKGKRSLPGFDSLLAAL